ncbi:MAG: HU family DNA-binding protein [Pirellulales bacterium]
MAKKTGPKAPTKSEIMNNMAETTGHTKKEIAVFFEALTAEIDKNVAQSGGPGQFTIPGLCKIVVQDKPAMPKREVRNPGTGEMVWAKPRPARRVIKVRALKGLKDMVL